MQEENTLPNTQPLNELEKALSERDEYLNGWKRAKADLINYQKEEGKRAQDFLKVANASIIIDLIPILDSFDLALSSNQSDKGTAMIKAQLEEVLKRYGAEKILVEPGSQLDTRNHEAVSEIESTYPSGSIAEEVSRGYTLNGKVIRPAKVKISK